MADPAKVELSGGFPNRGAMRGSRGVAAADHPLAAQAGMAVLREGGSAADAAVAMGAVMVVVQPQYSHLGGDGFAMAWDQASRSVSAMNSAGPAPIGLDVAAYRQGGRIPLHGALAVTVPGVVSGWWALHQRHGKLPWKRLFEDAIEYAANGFPASRGLRRAVRALPESARPSELGYFAGEGEWSTIKAGGIDELWLTLESIAEAGLDAFYEGEVASACVNTLREGGSAMTLEDWRPPARWVEPVAGACGMYDVHVQPPPTQGFVLPLALTPDPSPTAGEGKNVAMYRALEVALDVRRRELSDPDVTGFDPRRYLEPGGLSRLPAKASGTPVTAAADGDTTYLLAIDAEGNAVSWIQSIFAPWGSRVWVPAHGILMNNRMLGFTLEPGHPNEIAPGKRPAHTLHSYLVTREAGGRKELAVVGGTPGGYRQPQNNMQVLDHILRGGMDVQDALDEPRWSVALPGQDGKRRVEVEIRPGSALAAEFEAAGIEVIPFPAWDGQMGRSYVACREVDRSYSVGADLRGEGQALVW